MASEIHVLFRGALPHLKALSSTMAELGFPLKVRYAGGSMEQQRGFMPMWFRRDEIGVEFDVFEGRGLAPRRHRRMGGRARHRAGAGGGVAGGR
jgi:hypothetical protein